jgi:hypothetical protein
MTRRKFISLLGLAASRMKEQPMSDEKTTRKSHLREAANA